MTAPTTESKESAEGNGEKKRGGPRGPRQWRGKPTARERVMTQSLSAYIKTETGRDVSPETIRAVRFCLPKWNTSDDTAKLRENMDKRLEKAKLQDKREKALAMLKEAESELQKFAGTNELDETDDEDEDESDEDVEDYSDDVEDENDSDDEDVFGDDSPTKVQSEF